MGVEFGKPLGVNPTSIPGMVLIDLPVHGDARGWFKENWQRAKMTATGIGLPDFGPVQNNISFNDAVGTTRGIHAEPWDKYVSVATGRIFGAWVDLREGPTFGTVFTAEIDPSRAIFVPRGVGNAYQTLEPDTAYTYLVNDHWTPTDAYTFLNLADESVAIEWPISLKDAEISPKDREHPRLADVIAMPPRRTLVIGSQGQLGKALRERFGDATHIEWATRQELDLANDNLADARRWRDYGVIVNAAAFTAVDAAETPEGRAVAWRTNVTGVAALARIATDHGITLVHVSSDYVFDGRKQSEYTVDDALAPLGVYGQTKAAADAIVSTVPRHYILRTSWVIGDGNNFVRTMARLAARGVNPRVVSDQRGRLTFASTLALAIDRLLGSSAPFGVYNVTNRGEPASWYEIAQHVFRMTGNAEDRVTPVTAAEYFTDVSGPVSPRPANSVLAVDAEKLGFVPDDWRDALADYLRRHEAAPAISADDQP